MANKYKCIASSLNVRSGPGMAFPVIASIYNGEIVDVLEHENGWYKTDRGGWANEKYLAIYQQEPSIAANPPAQTTTTTANEESVAYGQRQEADLAELEDETKYSSFEDEPPELLDMVSTNKEYLNDINESLKTSTVRGIHGMPYQFLPIVDNRTDSNADSFGRKYAEKIVARMPLLLITPGVPKFMATYSDSDKRTILEYFTGYASNAVEGSLNSLLNKDGRFYSFKMDYQGYYEYVNALCRAVAHYMGIEDERVNGVRLGSFDWLGDIQSDLSKVIRYTKSVAFYIDSDKQIQESYSNDTGASMLKDKINGLSDSARELQFIMGGSSYLAKNGALGDMADRMFSAGDTNNIETTNQFVNDILGNGIGGMFSRITSNIQTLVSGGKLIFPEIWTDSSTGGTSWDITMKLHCPNPTPLGLYMDIMVPIIHCICLTAPKYATANGYTSPYLVRAFYKGMFNVDMGIITNLSISKGSEGSWSREGIPTSAEINMTIKDLYQSFMISKQETIMNNIGLLDYLANMCGINPNETDIFRQVELYLAFNSATRLRDLLRYDIFRGLEQWKDSVCYDIYSKLFR